MHLSIFFICYFFRENVGKHYYNLTILIETAFSDDNIREIIITLAAPCVILALAQFSLKHPLSTKVFVNIQIWRSLKNSKQYEPFV